MTPRAAGETARLRATLALTACAMLAEAAGGWRYGSLALWADAGHVLFDLLGLGAVLLAQAAAGRPANPRHPFGYGRIEVLAALANGLAILGVAGTIGRAAWRRWAEPGPIEAGPVMGMAAIALCLNAMNLAILGAKNGAADAHGHQHPSLTMRGATLHVLGDLLGAVAILIGGGIILATGFVRLDAILSLGIAAVLAIGSIGLLREAVDILLESPPPGLDTETIARAMVEVAGVHRVDALHLWRVGCNQVVLTAHVGAAGPPQGDRALCSALHTMLQRRFDLHLVTLQLQGALIAPRPPGRGAAVRPKQAGNVPMRQ